MQVFRTISDDRATIVTWRRRVSFFYVGIAASWFAIAGFSLISNNAQSQFASTKLDEDQDKQGIRARAQSEFTP